MSHGPGDRSIPIAEDTYRRTGDTPPCARRANLLRRGAPSVSLGLAGCVGGLPDSETPRGTAGLPGRLWFERASPSASERASVDPIVFQELSEGEREIVRTALEEGEYTVAEDRGLPAFESLRDRIEERTGNGETLEVYLRREDTYYRVGFADGDHLVAHPDQ